MNSSRAQQVDCRLGRFYLNKTDTWNMNIHTWQQSVREKEMKQMMGKSVGDLVEATPRKRQKMKMFRSSVD